MKSVAGSTAGSGVRSANPSDQAEFLHNCARRVFRLANKYLRRPPAIRENSPLAAALSWLASEVRIFAAVEPYFGVERNSAVTAPIRLWVAGFRITGARGHCRNALYMRPL